MMPATMAPRLLFTENIISSSIEGFKMRTKISQMTLVHLPPPCKIRKRPPQADW
jgi:hypothetical protein